MAAIERKLKKYRNLLSKHGYTATGSTKRKMERLRLEIELMRACNYTACHVRKMTYEQLRSERYGR